MNIRTLFALTILALSTNNLFAKPNIVIIVADDLGWNAIGYHNADVKTPNLDRLCSQGVELDEFYVSPMCSPTRAGLMTGRYPIRFGCARSVIPPSCDFGLPLTETTLAEALSSAGYEKRGVFGKWHLGHLQTKWHPTNRGFTDFSGCYNGAIDYFTFERDGQTDWHHNENSFQPKGYATTIIGDDAVEFIRTAATTKKPFFCYVPFTAPHHPLQAPQNYIDQYRSVKNKDKQLYYAMITAMDDQIGRIMAAIDEAGIDEETIVWFFSDNGGVAKIRAINAPLHGSKLTTFDGGVRTPACVRYPGVYPAGMKFTEPTAFIDVLPTVLSLADTTPEEAGCKPLDGLDLNPVLTGQEKQLPERELYFYSGQQGEASETIAVQSKPWKLVVVGPAIGKDLGESEKVLLYKLSEDPNEQSDLSAAYPEIVEALTAKLIEFRKLQPADGVPPYNANRKGFVTPKDWLILE